MPDTRYMTVIFRERDRAGVERLAQQVSTPGHPEYGRHRSRSELGDLVRLEGRELAAVQDWFTDRGMKLVERRAPNPQRLFVEATPAQIHEGFGENPEDWRELEMDVRRAPRIALPGHLGGYVQKISGVLGDLTPGTRRVYPYVDGTILRTQPPGPWMSPRGFPSWPEATGGMTPADIREIYNFPTPWDGTGETIALLMLGGGLNGATLERFWQAHDIKPPEVTVVHVGPQNPDREPNPIHDFEATMSVEWVGAMAPGAHIVVYYVDPTVFADPWGTFLMELVGDEEHSPTVASTSWVTPERDYYRKHGHRVIVGLLAQAACLGISIVAATGDWGPFDGVPNTLGGGRYVADAPWPHGVFPAVEEGVLGVGGTMITSRQPLTEIAWSGPLPLPLQPLLPQMRTLAGSGGFSDEVPIPQFQKRVLELCYPRGVGSPAVVPYGRGFPDVALMAAGPAIQPPDADALSCVGYQALMDQGWIDYAAGTSVAAPIWAAILAIANQARRDSGLGPVGWVNPVLYQLAKAKPAPFRPILAGAADAEMWALNEKAQAVPYHFEGYRCFAGWDPVTGLGVPDVAVLVDHLRDRSLLH